MIDLKQLNDEVGSFTLVNAIHINGIKPMRERIGVSQAVLAKLLGCGVHRVRSWEQGKCKADFVQGSDAMLLRLLDRLGYREYIEMLSAERSEEA